MLLIVVILSRCCMERIAFVRCATRDPMTLLVTSFSLSYLLQNLDTIIFSSRHEVGRAAHLLLRASSRSAASRSRTSTSSRSASRPCSCSGSGSSSRGRRSASRSSPPPATSRWRGCSASARTSRDRGARFGISGILARRGRVRADRAARRRDARARRPAGADRLRRGDHRRHGQPRRRDAWRVPARRADDRAPGEPAAVARPLPRRVPLRHRHPLPAAASAGARRGLLRTPSAPDVRARPRSGVVLSPLAAPCLLLAVACLPRARASALATQRRGHRADQRDDRRRHVRLRRQLGHRLVRPRRLRRRRRLRVRAADDPQWSPEEFLFPDSRITRSSSSAAQLGPVGAASRLLPSRCSRAAGSASR